MTTEFYSDSITIADTAFGQVTLNLLANAVRLRNITFEVNPYPNANGEYNYFTLTRTSQSSIATPATAGVILFDGVGIIVSTNGGVVMKCRNEYNLRNREIDLVKEQGQLFAGIQNESGASQTIRVEIEYDVIQ